jgi:hypothetical protein
MLIVSLQNIAFHIDTEYAMSLIVESIWNGASAGLRTTHDPAQDNWNHPNPDATTSSQEYPIPFGVT